MIEKTAINILIVDDREDGLMALEATLAAPDVRLIKARSGHEALSLIRDQDIAVILMDVQMPELDGFETAALIRQQENFQLTPIIFVTAINKDERYVMKGYELGAVDYIFKPFDPHILKSKVEVFVDLYLKTRQLQLQAEVIRESERRERYLRLAELEVESLKRYQSLADAIPHLVWRARTDGLLDYCNSRMLEYSGLTLEQCLGTGWQSAFHPDDLKTFLKIWLQAMVSGDPFDLECRLRRNDGAMRWHWVRAIPTLQHGQVTSWLGTGTDIHDRKLAEEEINTAKQQAIDANKAKSNFLANMSHEIRTPLNAILGFTELLLKPDQSADEKLAHAETIHRSGRQLLKIINEILDISKIEAGRLQVEQIEMDILSLFSDIRSLLRNQASEKHLDLDFSLESTIPRKIFSDPTRIQQILLNVIGNAIKFTNYGKISVAAHWTGLEHKNPQRLFIRVTDTGIGISEDQAARLFQPFVQLDSSTTRRFGGTGLGLSLSRKLAQALGGSVYLAESQLGHGSTFIIELKAEPVTGTNFSSELEERDNEMQIHPFTPRDTELLKGVDVLVIDDAPDNQRLIRHFLVSAGARVDLAKDGNEGIKKALANNYQVVLMDIQMPDLDGYEATTRLRRKGYDRPILALTAHALKEERDRCLKAGCTEHLTKPINRKVLIENVARYVNMSELPGAKQNGH